MTGLYTQSLSRPEDRNPVKNTRPQDLFSAWQLNMHNALINGAWWIYLWSQHLGGEDRRSEVQGHPQQKQNLRPGWDVWAAVSRKRPREKRGELGAGGKVRWGWGQKSNLSTLCCVLGLNEHERKTNCADPKPVKERECRRKVILTGESRIHILAPVFKEEWFVCSKWSGCVWEF